MKKVASIVFAVCGCLLIIILCVVLTSFDYGCETTFYSHNGESVYFDGKGRCTDGEAEYSYYIRRNQYYIKGGKVTRKMTLVEDGVLVDFSKSEISLDTKVRSGYFDAKFNVAGEQYSIREDGTFGRDYGKFVVKLGDYFYNDGVLAFRYDSKDVYSGAVRVLYLYVDNSGDIYGVLLAEPERFFRR